MAGIDSPRTVLLTGYPCFIARQMAEVLLASDPELRVYAIVLGKFVQRATEHRNKLAPEHATRLVLLEGDASAMDMGLSRQELGEVCAHTQRIYHFARTTHLSTARPKTHYINVQGTIEALEVAKLCDKLQSLVLLSSTLVSGTRKGLVLESELEAGQSYRSPVEESLVHAERIARRAQSKVPLVVLRPSIVIGDSTTGAVDKLDGPYTLMMLVMNSPSQASVPLPLRSNALMHLVPVDYVVRAALRISQDARSVGRTFHIVDSAPLPARRVFELVAHASGHQASANRVPAQLAWSLLRAPGIEHLVKSPRAFVQTLMTDVRYDSRNTEELLAGTDVLCPPFESYVDQLVSFMRQHMRERRRSEAPRPKDTDDPLS